MTDLAIDLYTPILVISLILYLLFAKCLMILFRPSILDLSADVFLSNERYLSNVNFTPFFESFWMVAFPIFRANCYRCAVFLFLEKSRYEHFSGAILSLQLQFYLYISLRCLFMSFSFSWLISFLFLRYTKSSANKSDQLSLLIIFRGI